MHSIVLKNPTGTMNTYMLCYINYIIAVDDEVPTKPRFTPDFVDTVD